MFSGSMKEQMEDTLVNSTGIQPDLADDAVKVGTETIFSGFKDEIMGGNISGVTNLLSGGVKDIAQNSIVTSITNKVVSALASKVGIPEAIASKAASVMVPFVMKLVKDKDEDESAFSMGGMMSLLSGDKSEEESGDLLGGITKGLGGFFS